MGGRLVFEVDAGLEAKMQDRGDTSENGMAVTTAIRVAVDLDTPGRAARRSRRLARPGPGRLAAAGAAGAETVVGTGWSAVERFVILSAYRFGDGRRNAPKPRGTGIARTA
jgi:hypothetical protein